MRQLYTKQRGLSIITLDAVDEAVVNQAARPQHHRIDVVEEGVDAKQRCLSNITLDVVDEAAHHLG